MTPYQDYVYAYPHKTAYRPLAPRPRLRDIWADEPRDALFHYVHIPFCEIRCGFCNLFTRTGAPAELVTRYLDALDRQAAAVRAELAGRATFVQAAIGGGTPTYLDAGELERLLDIVGLPGIPLSVETSPDTATPDRLAVLAERGATRISCGVQSFDDKEAKAAVRPQKRAVVESALDAIRAAGFPVLNIDLIYGITGQTDRSWLASVDAALAWQPEELYLYPLYVRPLTGLAGRETPQEWDEQRMRLYRLGRDHLLAAGYEQQSMRMFRRADAPSAGGDDYSCQSDGMVGLGCGARSYTREMHYSFDYAVSPGAVRGIIDDYVSRPSADFAVAEVGVRLDPSEQRRRHLLQSVLQADGLEKALYRERFTTDVTSDFPELAALADRGWLTESEDHLRLTPEGLAWSDAIGPSLFSPAVRAAMAAYDRR
ncbi:STM4012 family radical SAM protein [Kibdelosporangium phytohabitans]|uniref:Heme chaperone HemW n=1 Tax=Kibdelosporangium phytohabitans TaxID=860235 RepID=A0A0N9I8T4_9PSEU|nr:STM4012 family radical SAM protein [Kibdelosporangium phytohabitans]ALG11322.1 coproporphyrinogen III oxidase [Kibdelosporangium phytohabitans]MBE1462627.1 oxygen-independent coproporphyrinogen-3 oxidase [Kibdelosporangium phytohabitans]